MAAMNVIMRGLGATLVVLLCLNSTAHAAGLWEQLKKTVGVEKKEPGTDSGSAVSDLAQEILLEAAREALAIPEEEEVAIGRQLTGSLLGAAPLVDDDRLQEYVGSVGRWVASQSERPGLTWHFGVVESDDINAFAAPGGFILVTHGLYRMLQSESELAGVLAHEIAHVAKKHHLEILQQTQLVDMGGKMLAKPFADSEYVQEMIGDGAEMFSRSLDRNAEYEADRVAVVLAARAGYDPFGLPTVLQDIGRLAADDSSVQLLFTTHPHPEQRLAQLDEVIGDRFDGLGGQTLEGRFDRMGH